MTTEEFGTGLAVDVSGERSDQTAEEGTNVRVGRRTVLKGMAVAGLVGTGVLSVGTAPAGAVAGPGGPVVLMGIDADDTGHADDSIFAGVVADILSNVTNGGSGLLVVGANGHPATGFWNNMGSLNGESVTNVTGATDIANQDFTGFAMIGVASSLYQTTNGLTQAENDALVGRAADIADFVNGGGGLFGLSQTRLTNAWDYLGSIGAFATLTGADGVSYSDVTATADGNDVGIDDDNLDVCCWHDVFTEFPAFLAVLATNAESSDPGFEEAAALGGASVVIRTCPGTEVPLIAGRNEEVGTVSVQEDGDEVGVTYTLNEGWFMTESHLHLAADCGDIPQTRSGNPKVGRFDYGDSYAPAVRADTVVLDRTDHGFTAGQDVCVAAHAVVFEDVNENGTCEPDVDRPETAWGEGERFTSRGNWAMHFTHRTCE